jgi:hypothetical protein
MLRLLIGTGLLLMVVGFGAAGWQYWQGQSGPAPVAAAAPVAEAPPQAWLLTSSGALVDRADLRAFLLQDRLVRERLVELEVTAPLSALVSDGETLPEPAFLPVFADVRAPRIARPLCPVMTDGFAAACAVHSARAVPDSVDPVRGTARFRIALAFRAGLAAGALPDLTTHVLHIDRLEPAAEVAVVTPVASAEAALATALAAASAYCSVPERAAGCRLLRLSVDWAPGTTGSYRAEIGWLSPLPEGMFPAPDLTSQPEG